MFGRTLFAALALCAAGLAQAAEPNLEPCMNGNVSRTGIWPTQLPDGSAAGRLNWQSYDPYYLFAVSASYLESPFAETVDGEETAPAAQPGSAETDGN